MFDKFGIRRTTVPFFIITALAMGSLIGLTSGYLVVIPAVLFGITTSIQVMSYTCLTNKLFGEKDYSSNLGLINTLLFLGIAIGVPLSAFIYEAFGTYKNAWTLYGALMRMVMAAILAANRMSKKAFQDILGFERS